MKYFFYIILLIISPSLFAAGYLGNLTHTIYPDSGSCIEAQKAYWFNGSPQASCVKWKAPYNYGPDKLSVQQDVDPSGCVYSGAVWCSHQCSAPYPPVCNAPGVLHCHDDCTCTCDLPCSQTVSPCDSYTDASKKLSCNLGLSWSAADCKYIHTYGCGHGSGEDSGPFGGYYPASATPVGSKTCAYGCEYMLDEKSETTGQVHMTLTGASCVETANPDSMASYDSEDIETGGDTWQPDNDKDPSTNCGEFNGEYMCIESIPNGTCVSSPSGAIVCVSPPPVTPQSYEPMTPDLILDTPGPNPSDPGDDDHVEIYPKPGTKPYVCDPAKEDCSKCNPMISNCGNGGSVGGFVGPELESRTFLIASQEFYSRANNSPLLASARNIAVSFPSGGCCPFNHSFTLFNHSFSFSVVCGWYDEIKPILSAAALYLWGVAALIIVLSA